MKKIIAALALLARIESSAEIGNITPGPCFVPMGEIAFTGNTVATTNPGAGQYTLVAGTTAAGEVFQLDTPQAGRLWYIGDGNTHCHMGATLSLKSAGANDVTFARIYKNGLALTAGTVQQKLFAVGDIGSTAIHVMGEMAQNDYIELFVNNATSSSNLTVTDMNLFAMCVQH